MSRGALSPTIRWELQSLAKLGLLEDGEVLCEVENALPDGESSGVLVVTDRRVLSVATGFFKRETSVRQVALTDISHVHAANSEFWWRLGRGRGVLHLEVHSEGGEPSRLTFERIPGGRVRAQQIADTIKRQQELLRRGTSTLGNPRPDKVDSDATGEVRRTTISVGRGVAAFVRARGGKLWVWGEPAGGGFDRMRASVTAPGQGNFLRSDVVEGFELYIDENLTTRGDLRLARRWLPRAGVTVDTGLIVS